MTKYSRGGGVCGGGGGAGGGQSTTLTRSDWVSVLEVTGGEAA
jgi:hypothetical protein